MLHLILAAAAAAISPAPTLDAPVAPASTGPAQAADRPQRYCVIDSITGSMISRRICQTREQWLAQGFDPLAPRR